jgi:hypothetical protein
MRSPEGFERIADHATRIVDRDEALHFAAAQLALTLSLEDPDEPVPMTDLIKARYPDETQDIDLEGALPEDARRFLPSAKIVIGTIMMQANKQAQGAARREARPFR